MKKKRITAVLLATAMTIGTLSGCGTQPSSTNTTDSKTPTQEAVQKETDEKEETVKLNYYFWYAQTQPDMENVYHEINSYVKDKINVDVVFHGMTRDDYQQKIPTIMASGGDWDICFTSGNLNNYLPNVAKSAFAPLNTLLDTEGKDVKALIPDSLWNAVSVEGNIYGVPMYKEIGHSLGWFVDKQIADECGIELTSITSLEGLDAALRTVKEKMPDVMPYAIDNSIDYNLLPIEHSTGDWNLPGVLNIPDINAYPNANDQKGQTVFNQYEQPEFKELVTQVHTWWLDGLVPKDPLGWKDKQDSEIKAGKVFALNMWTAPNYDAVFSKDMGRTYVWIPAFDPIFESSDAFGGLNAINAQSPNKEAAMKFLNLWNTDKDLGNLMKHGILGTHYEMSGEQADPSKIAGYDATSPVQPYNQSSAWQYFTIFNQSWDVSYPANIADIYKDWNDNAKPSPNLGFTYDNSKMQTQIAALQTTLGQYRDALMYGTGDPEKMLPEFIDKMQKNGSNELIQDVQSQLDAWRAAQ